MSECACGQQTTLWKTPVENSEKSSADATSFVQEINLLNLSEVVDALAHATGLLSARLDAIELHLAEIMSIIGLPAEERIRRIREIREGMANAPAEA